LASALLLSAADRDRLGRPTGQDVDHLLGGGFRPLAEWLFGQATQRVLDHRPAHIRYAGGFGRNLTARREDVGGDQDGRDTLLFEFNAVEQTAR
jgi:hypothetical protein